MNSRYSEAVKSHEEKDVGQLFESCFDLMESGVELNGSLTYLYEQGATVCEAWHISGKLYGGLEKSGRAIVKHPLWQATLKTQETTPGSWAEYLIKFR
jgi:hypothetical protein